MDANEPALTLLSVRRMMEGVVPPALCTASVDGMPNINYLSLVEYVDPEHVALSYQFFNRSRENVLATRRASLTLDDPYTAAGVVMQLRYVRTELAGPTFERIRAKLAGIASHVGMEKVFQLRGADIYQVLELRRVPGRRELPAAAARCDLAGSSRKLSERMAQCLELDELVDVTLHGLDELLRIDHSMLWLLDPGRDCMVLLASRGYDTVGTGAEISLTEGVAGVAAREGVPIRVGHMMNMQTYARAARGRAGALGFDNPHQQDIPLPGLAAPRSQLAVPLRARGRVLGVLFVESQHDQYFGYDDEDALMMLCGQLAGALTLMQPVDSDSAAPVPVRAGAAAAVSGPPLCVKRFQQDNSIFFDNQYVIRGVAGAILWKLATEYTRTGRMDFTNKELRLAADLNLPEVQDNLEARLVVLQRRLAEHRAATQIEKTGRGRFRFNVARPLELEDVGK